MNKVTRSTAFRQSATASNVIGPAIAVVWLLVPFTTGELLDIATNDDGDSLRLVISIGGWVLWAAVLTCTLIRRPVSLTCLRVGTSAAVVGSIIAALTDGSVSTRTIVIGVTVPTVAWLASMSATAGQVFVDGASYGDEMRFPLRAPAALLAGPVPLAWAITLIGAALGPLLLGSERWIAGSLALMVGWPASFFALRALHGLARRWLVFVPAGVVIHDFLTSREPFLMMRNTVATFGPADADATLEGADLLDATQGAAGMVLMLELDKAVETVPRPPRGSPTKVKLVNRVAVVPTRPGASLVESRARRIG